MSPMVANWIVKNLRIPACSLRKLRLRDATDLQVFAAARRANAIVLTKDRDIPELARLRGAPPNVIWVRLGNSSNAALCGILMEALPDALQRIKRGDVVVEIDGEP